MVTSHRLRRDGNQLARTFADIGLVLYSIIAAFPLLLALLNAFRKTVDIVAAPLSFARLTPANFIYAFTKGNADIFMMYRNSALLTVVSLTIIVAISSLCGYFIARRGGRIGNVLLLVFLAGLMIPDEITLLPLVRMFAKLGIIGKLWSMFIYYAGHNTAVAIFMYAQFIKTVPRELDESALMDGAGSALTFSRIIFPLLKPCTATVLVFVGFHIWNDFMVPLYLLRGAASQTITLGVYTALGPYHSNWGLVFAFVVIASLPIVALYAFMQKWFIDGLTAGAVKA